MEKTILQLYKQVLRAGNQFKDYNFREYVVRRAKEDFRELQINPDLKTKIVDKYNKELGIIKRQALIQNLYYVDNHVVEQRQQCEN